ncbi:transposase [Lysobacter hankyongensis]|uniref:Transposase n=2 Tax=Lysobacter hankyongensis TaxID=1176535 RepID=A0ABP9BCT8_9GAMM
MPGGTYFFTVTLANRSSSLLTDHVDLLGRAMREVRTRHPFETVAIVVLPDHLHAIWRLPKADAAYSMRWRMIKALFTRQLVDAGVWIPQRTKGERRVWARRFWEHTIRDESDMRHHVDYIHFNPVKHGWVERAIDWPYSSLHRRVGEGIAGAVAPAMRDAAHQGSTPR